MIGRRIFQIAVAGSSSYFCFWLPVALVLVVVLDVVVLVFIIASLMIRQRLRQGIRRFFDYDYEHHRKRLSTMLSLVSTILADNRYVTSSP